MRKCFEMWGASSSLLLPPSLGGPPGGTSQNREEEEEEEGFIIIIKVGEKRSWGQVSTLKATQERRRGGERLNCAQAAALN